MKKGTAHMYIILYTKRCNDKQIQSLVSVVFPNIILWKNKKKCRVKCSYKFQHTCSNFKSNQQFTLKKILIYF